MGEQQLPGVFMNSRTPKSEANRTQMFKYILIVLNIFYFILGLGLLGVCIWMIIDRTFLMYVTGNALYAAGVYIGFAAAILIIIVTGLGLLGALIENRIMLWVYFFVVSFLVFVLILGGVLAAIFNTQIGTAMQDAMTTTLLESYGVNFNNYWNELVTKGWDMTQEKLNCCGVQKESWQLYLQSKWYETQVGTPEQEKPLVPLSCCVRDRWWRVLDPYTCQRWELGPPKQPSGSGFNGALSYEGCYDAMKQFCYDNVVVITTIMIIIGLSLIASAVISFFLIRRLPKEPTTEKQALVSAHA